MATRTNTKGSNARGSKANTKGGKAKERETIEVISYNIKRAVECRNGVILFDLELNGVCIYGCHIAESRDGEEFIGFPSRKGNDGKYYSVAYSSLSEDDTADILDSVRDALE